EWARMFGRNATWGSGDVRGLQIWGRTVGGRLEVAFRAELFGQIHARDLAHLSHPQLSPLCVLYGVGTPVKVRGGDQRAIKLDEAFLADLLDSGRPAEADGPTDGQPSHTRPCAEPASGCPGGGEEP